MSSTSSTVPQVRSSAVVGVVFMLFGVFLFASNDALGKWLVGTYSVGQILLLRSIAALALLVPFIRREGFRRIATPRRRGLHLARAAGSTLEVALFYWALSYLPLASVMTFYLAGPIYVTALSAIILREKVGWVRWTAVLVGFVGVLIALGPDLARSGWPALIAVAGSLAYAFLLISTRVLAQAGETTLITWQVGAALVLGLVLAPVGWVTPSGFDLVFLGLLGIVSMGGHVCVNRSLLLAPASVVVPYQYTLILWAVLFGVVFFDERPGPTLLAGAALITLSGVFIFLREQRLSRGQATATSAGMVAAPDGVQIDPTGDER